MKTILCLFCGEKILVIPNVEAMTRVIEEHADKHWNNQAVADDLSKQVLKAASSTVET